MGMWLIMLHNALTAQAPGQGFSHLLRIHALLRGQSVFKMHSGRQPMYGSPWNSDKHVHTPSEHLALEPQGDGTQASCTGVRIAVKYNWLIDVGIIKHKSCSIYVLCFTYGNTIELDSWCLRVVGNNSQEVNVFPVYPSGHLHVGIWLTTEHKALVPHEPRHGSIHFILMQALSLGHSECIVHSGLQLGGWLI